MTAIRYELTFQASADVARGPVGRFIELANEIEADGLVVPPEIAAVLADLTKPRSEQ